LNPEGLNDKKIIELIDKIPDLTGDRQELNDAMAELINTSQLLLKEEWEKVKKESIEGNLVNDTKFSLKLKKWLNII
jgi:hypothetical protein